jgi:hypothetical protein
MSATLKMALDPMCTLWPAAAATDFELPSGTIKTSAKVQMERQKKSKNKNRMTKQSCNRNAGSNEQ